MQKLAIYLMIAGFFSSAQSALAENIPTHCVKDEVTLFACPIKKKVLSYCAGPQKPPYTYIEYRYGVPGKVEKTFRADGIAKKQFYVRVTPLKPVVLTELGFSDGGHNYALETCSGGMCAGDEATPKLLITKGNKEIARLQCLSVEPSDDPLERFPFTITWEPLPDDKEVEVPKVVTTSKLLTSP